jgi:hypothetical protein
MDAASTSDRGMSATDADGTDRAGSAIPLRPRRPAPIGVRPDHLAAETARLYAGDWDRFVAFCGVSGARALPASAETVAAFLRGQQTGRTARARRLAAIDHRHQHHGWPRPGDDPAVRRALKQARAAAPRRFRPPPPAPSALREAALRCPRDLAGLRDRAVLILLGLGLSRQLVVGLHAERLRFGEDGVRVAGPGAAAIALPRAARHDLCPVRALEAWLNTSATRFGPVFRKVTRWGTVEPQALGADAVRRILLRRCW